MASNFHRFLTLENFKTGAEVGVSGLTSLAGFSFLFCRFRLASIFSCNELRNLLKLNANQIDPQISPSNKDWLYILFMANVT